MNQEQATGEIFIRRRETEEEARAAAAIMAGTDPWITLKRSAEHTCRDVTNPGVESYVAMAKDEVIGVLLIRMGGPLINGYISGIAVREDWRNRGIGSQLLAFGEERILRDSPNVFLSVCDFNEGARRLYERKGYETVGRLEELLIPGHAEILMRKTTGPWATFRAR